MAGAEQFRVLRRYCVKVELDLLVDAKVGVGISSSRDSNSKRKKVPVVRFSNGYQLFII
jgi:hypothetical protein